MVLLRTTLREAEVFGDEGRLADDKLWLRITPDMFVLDDADLGLLRLGVEMLLTGLGMFSESSGSTGTGMLLDEDIALLAVESSAALEEPRTSTG